MRSPVRSHLGSDRTQKDPIPRGIVLFARTALAGLIGLALVGLFVPSIRPTEVFIRPDNFSHALVIYALTLLAGLALPRLHPAIICLALVAAAVGVEIAQYLGILNGAAQASDLAADLVGIFAAILPIGVARVRRFGPLR